jgi:hypothetical protein
MNTSKEREVSTMKNTIDNALAMYGFLPMNNRTYCKGQGSISNGRSVKVEIIGKVAKVTTETWFCNGDIESDSQQEFICWLGDVFEYIPVWAL